ncbi:Lumazine-binding protein [Hysterangium stoloniferum]|nr:Lumazine-binding protein [Hysterangium stoloniferum]
MFTGLVEHMGYVSSIVPLDTTESGGEGWSMTISNAAEILDDCHIGDSISVNGACLTVTEHTTDSFKVGLAPETLEKTNLGKLAEGDYVNLERAMAAHVRFGGHFVQGHVDSTATIVSIIPDENSMRFLFKLPEGTSLLPYIIPKGYIAIDGISLTLTSVSDMDHTFGVMIIAHTQNKVTLARKSVGETVNIEVDMLGKYVEKAVIASFGGDSESPGSAGEGLRAMIEKVVERVLKEKGI